MLKNNYVVYHLHSDISSAVTNIDSINKPEHYVDYAKSLGMVAMAFSEHGNVMGWKHKKDIIFLKPTDSKLFSYSFTFFK